MNDENHRKYSQIYPQQKRRTVLADAFCNSVEDTENVAAAFEREKEFIAKSYHVKPEDLEIYCLKHIQVAKISLPRVPVEGSRDERDMHGGQQYVSLLDIEC